VSFYPVRNIIVNIRKSVDIGLTDPALCQEMVGIDVLQIGDYQSRCAHRTGSLWRVTWKGVIERQSMISMWGSLEFIS
jgi:hypothetical protein